MHVCLRNVRASGECVHARACIFVCVARAPLQQDKEIQHKEAQVRQTLQAQYSKVRACAALCRFAVPV